jgi:hypothetical protein
MFRFLPPIPLCFFDDLMAFLDEVAWPQQPAWPTGLITDGEVAACAEDPLGFKANLNPKPNNGYPRILKGGGHRGS